MLRTSFGKFAAIGVLALSSAVHAENVVKRFLRPNTRVGLSVPLHVRGASDTNAWFPLRTQAVPLNKDNASIIGQVKVPVAWSWASNAFVKVQGGMLGKGVARAEHTTEATDLLTRSALLAASIGGTKIWRDCSFSLSAGLATVKKDWFKTLDLHGLVDASVTYKLGSHQVGLTSKIFPTNTKGYVSSNYAPFYTLGVDYSYAV